MDKPARSRTDKTIIAAVVMAVVLLLGSGAVLELWFNRSMKKTAVEQFNAQQMVIARNIKRMIENRLVFLQKELLLVCKKIPADAFDPEAVKTDIWDSLSRVAENGVVSLDITDIKTGASYIYASHRCRYIKEVPGGNNIPDGFLKTLPLSSENGIWISRPEKEPSGIVLFMGRHIDGSMPKAAVFKVNLSWFLGPLLRNISSGKIGYAWVIDDRGIFLFHPEPVFIGDDAFTAREKKIRACRTRRSVLFRRKKCLKDWKAREGM